MPEVEFGNEIKSKVAIFSKLAEELFRDNFKIPYEQYLYAYDTSLKKGSIVTKSPIEKKIITQLDAIFTKYDMMNLYKKSENEFKSVLYRFFMKNPTNGFFINSYQTNVKLIIVVIEFKLTIAEFELYKKSELFTNTLSHYYSETDKILKSSIKNLNFNMFSANTNFKYPCLIAMSKELESFVDENMCLQLFDYLNQISNLKYEGSESIGTILFINSLYADVLVTFLRPVGITETKYIRKLLETTTDELSLIFFGDKIVGLGKAKDGLNVKYSKVEFVKSNKWHFIGNSYSLEKNKKQNKFKHILFEVENAIPKIFEKPIDKVLFTKIMLKKFDGKNPKTDLLFEFIEEASKQKHGTTIVILKNEKAISEVERLSKKSTPIANKKQLTKEMIKPLTSIDGALILDLDGICHAIGTILDGITDNNVKSDPERGSRYNSAVLYQYNHRSDCVVIVISEDGYINIICN